MPKNNQLREGWGLSYRPSDQKLYASDGSQYIYVIDPNSWNTIQTIEVHDLNGKKLSNINELEIIPNYDGYIFANAWMTNFVYMIELASGNVVKQWDMTELVDIQKKHVGVDLSYDWTNAVLNGIAYYGPNDSFLLTGKLWDFVFEVNLEYKI